MMKLFLVVINLLSIFVASTNSINEILEYFSDERDGLLQLRDSVTSNADLHSNWTGPPCINSDSKWVGIGCSDIGHVVHIVLEGIELTGSLPPTFLLNITFLTKLSFRNNTISGPLPTLTNLVHLEYVILSQNWFWGSIPLEYAELLPKLKVVELQENYLDGHIPPFDHPTLTAFNVSYNHLEGPIPNTHVLQRFPSSSYDHNSGLCGSPLEKPCPPSPTPVDPQRHKNKTLHLWSIVLIVALVPLLVILFSFCYCRKLHSKQKTSQQNQPEIEIGDPESIEDIQRNENQLEFFEEQMSGGFDLDDLLRASAQMLGKGKLGTTYKTTLESGTTVAVKRLQNMNGLSKKEFIQQMQLLGRMRHENLVQIISFYYSKEEKLIISEFVPNGSLFELLHENRGVGRVALKWEARICIIRDIAKGLAFLHQYLPRHQVPHGNLKSSNVLIQQDFYHSKLSDFGFLPLLPSRKHSEMLAVAKSPEFIQGKKLSNKADVYCFGIILLEIITGRIPGEISDDEISTATTAAGGGDLSDWVRMVVSSDWSTDILDVEILAATEGHDDMLKLTEIALECTDLIPEKRPKMTQVLQRIQEIIEQKND